MTSCLLSNSEYGDNSLSLNPNTDISNDLSIGDNLLRPIIQLARQHLTNFSTSNHALEQLADIFENSNRSDIETLLSAWLLGDFSFLPRFQVLDDSAMHGAQGGFASETGTVYLANSLVNQDMALYQDPLVGAVGVVLEEIGHGVDALLNPQGDTAGDEGELFRALVLGLDFNSQQLADIYAENDRGIVVIDGQRISIEQATVRGNHRNNVLRGTNQSDVIFGYSGNDRLYGLAGHDRMIGHAGNDVLYGYAGNDRLEGHQGHDVVYGHDGHDVVLGGDHNDRLYGGNHNDRLFGQNGNDRLFGGAGNDLLDGGSGVDYLDGGGDIDRVSYASYRRGVHLNLRTGWVAFPGTASSRERVVNIEQVTGSLGNDVLIGNQLNNAIFGHNGNDTINAYGGALYERDHLTGGAGRDRFILGNANSAYYVRSSNVDYALIADLNRHADQVQLHRLSGVVHSTSRAYGYRLQTVGRDTWLRRDSDGQAIALIKGQTGLSLISNTFTFVGDQSTARPDLKRYQFYYNFNPNNYRLADSYTGSVIAPAGRYTVDQIFDPGNRNTEVGQNGSYYIYGVEDYDDNLTSHAGQVFVHAYIDRDSSGTARTYIPYKYSQGRQPAGLNYLGSEEDHIHSSRTVKARFGRDFYEADPTLEKFIDPSTGTDWNSVVYAWDETAPNDSPSLEMVNTGITHSEALGVINLGSQTRRDGKAGILANWGANAPNNDLRLPDDFFAMRSYTQYQFDGSEYRFRVRADDGFQILAKRHGSNEWLYITPQHTWEQAYGDHREYTWRPPVAGTYDLHFHMFEGGGDAYIDLSWERGSGAPLLQTQNAQYFSSRPQFYMPQGNPYANAGWGSSVLGNGWRMGQEGNCTWYAYGRLKALGFTPEDIMNGYPNASQWAPLRNGARVLNSNETPQLGDVAQWLWNGQNHVAIVEKVENGRVFLSESHYSDSQLRIPDYDGDLDGDGITYDGTLHRIVSYTLGAPQRYLRLTRH